MDIVERIKIEVRQKNWLESIRRQQESGMDVKEWCLQEKISRSTYYYRLRKVREHLCEQMTPEFAKRSTVPTGSRSGKCIGSCTGIQQYGSSHFR